MKLKLVPAFGWRVVVGLIYMPVESKYSGIEYWVPPSVNQTVDTVVDPWYQRSSGNTPSGAGVIDGTARLIRPELHVGDPTRVPVPQ